MQNDHQDKFDSENQLFPNVRKGRNFTGVISLAGGKGTGSSFPWIQTFVVVLLSVFFFAPVTIIPANAFQIPASAVTDEFGNRNVFGDSASVTDRKPPVPTQFLGPNGQSTGNSYSDNSSIDLTLEFDENIDVNSLVPGDFDIENGTVTNVGQSGSSQRNFTITIQPAGSGTITVTLRAGTVVDLASTPNASGTPIEITIDDGIKPVATLSYLQPGTGDDVYGGTASFEVDLKFTEDVFGLSAGGFTVDSGNASVGPLNIDSATEYRVTVTPDGTGGDIVLTLNADAAFDADGGVGNGNDLVSITIREDAVGPTIVSVIPSIQEYTNINYEIDVTVTFDGPVENFDGPNADGDGDPSNDDVVVTNGTWTLENPSGDNTVFTITVTPNSDASGAIGFRVPASRREPESYPGLRPLPKKKGQSSGRRAPVPD